jgi:hypothetical protein
MNEEPFKGYQCWRTDRITKVINKEAVATDKATFLATHMPFKSISYERMPRQILSTNEEELLDELFKHAETDQHLFGVVQGIPGTGKSHLIRWLFEHYRNTSEAQGHRDIVILIERANNTLRQTLLQILEADVGLLQHHSFAAERERLTQATQHLSEQGLENALLSSFHVAHVELYAESTQALPRGLGERLGHFLLDPVVREYLRRDDGPIKRLVRRLSSDHNEPTIEDEAIFQESDFNFPYTVLRQLRAQGYKEAKDLVETLPSREDKRLALARYLNDLVGFAVSHTTSLSDKHLKEMFNKLRRELRNQDRNLALFVEDITAFTGLDSGLLDILATQHTGEGNRQFCRLLSVIGITDAYFRDRFPDNMRERITHHLTLNMNKSGHREAAILDSDSSVASLAARYLNAIRLSEEDLGAWLGGGARYEEIPNACVSCPHRPVCHTAFGYTSLDEQDGEDKRIGLYPFNHQALNTMYDQIDPHKVSRTPRTLLNSVLEYVLLSHGHLIPEGQFPPQRNLVGNDFDAPHLAKPLQYQLLERPNILSSARERTESFVVFWGDRTLDEGWSTNGQPTIGGLLPEAFAAFELPFIHGAPDQPPPVVEPPPQVVDPPEPAPKVEPETEEGQSPYDEIDPFVDDIEKWRAGASLQRYDELAAHIAGFVQESIDWSALGVSISLVEERIRQAHLVIEEQAGRNPSYYHELTRSDLLADSLLALHDLNTKDKSLAPARYGAHLVSLSEWLEEYQGDFVSFVQGDQGKEGASPYLLDLLVENVFSLACLDECIDTTASDPIALSTSLLRSCDGQSGQKTSRGSREGAITEWDALRSRAEIEREAGFVRGELLQNINCRQGRSRDVRFIDGAKLLEAVDKLIGNDAQLSNHATRDPGRTWTAISRTNRTLSEHFHAVISLQQENMRTLVRRLEGMTGGNPGKQVKNTIVKTLDDFRQAQVAFDAQVYWPNNFDGDAFDARRDALRAASKQHGQLSRAIAVSKALRAFRDATEDAKYLSRVEQLFRNQARLWREEINVNDAAGTNIGQLIGQAEGSYGEITAALEELSRIKVQ